MATFIFVLTADESPTNWTFVKSGGTVNDVLAGCYNAANRQSWPKSDYSGTSIQPASIQDCISGSNSTGTIYRISRRTASAKVSAAIPVLLLISLFLFNGCKSGKELTYRYSSKTIDADYKTMGTLVDVDANFQAIPAPQTPTVTTANLDPKVQRALINALAHKVKTGDSLFNYMAAAIKSKTDPKPFLTTNLSFTRRVNISVRDLSPYDADRIAKLSITLKDPNNVIRFTGCDKIITQYQTIDLADLSFKNNNYGEVDAGATYGGTVGTSNSSSNRNANHDTVTNTKTFSGATGVNVSGKLGFNNEFDGTASLQRRYVALSGNFKDNTISFYQESTTGVNLNGTIISDITFEFNSNNNTTYVFYSFDNLFDKDNVVIVPAKVTVARSALTVPNIAPGAVYTLDLTYTAVYRQVADNDKYIAEGYHNVKFLQGSNTKAGNTVLIKAQDILPKKWVLHDAVTGKNVTIGIGGSTGDLYFTSYENAFNFFRWLLRSAHVNAPISSDGYLLKDNGAALANGDLANISIAPAN